MSRATSREDGVVSFDYNLMHESIAASREDGIVPEEVRACKRIAPIVGEVRTGKRLKSQVFSAANPRIVRLDFNTPPNWTVVDSVQNGEYLGFLQGVGHIYHSCQRVRWSHKDARGYRGVESYSGLRVKLVNVFD